MLREQVLDPALALLQCIEVALQFAETDDCGEKIRNL